MFSAASVFTRAMVQPRGAHPDRHLGLRHTDSTSDPCCATGERSPQWTSSADARRVDRIVESLLLDEEVMPASQARHSEPESEQQVTAAAHQGEALGLGQVVDEVSDQVLHPWSGEPRHEEDEEEEQVPLEASLGELDFELLFEDVDPEGQEEEVALRPQGQDAVEAEEVVPNVLETEVPPPLEVFPEYVMLRCNDEEHPDRHTQFPFDNHCQWGRLAAGMQQRRVCRFYRRSHCEHDFFKNIVFATWTAPPGCALQMLGLPVAMSNAASAANQHPWAQPQLGGVVVVNPLLAAPLNRLLVKKDAEKEGEPLNEDLQWMIVSYLTQGTIFLPWLQFARWIQAREHLLNGFEAQTPFVSLMALATPFIEESGLAGGNGFWAVRDAAAADIRAFVTFLHVRRVSVTLPRLPGLIACVVASVSPVPKGVFG